MIQVRGDLHIFIRCVVQPEIRPGIAVGDGIDLAPFCRDLKHVGREGPPFHIGFGVNTGLMQQDREEIFARRSKVCDPDGLAFEIGQLLDPGGLQRNQTRAAAMGPGGDLDVEALLQRLEPTQRHADAAVRLAGGDGLQQRLGRGTEVHDLDLKPVFLEYAMVLRNKDRGKADRRCVRGEPERFKAPCPLCTGQRADAKTQKRRGKRDANARSQQAAARCGDDVSVHDVSPIQQRGWK